MEQARALGVVEPFDLDAETSTPLVGATPVQHARDGAAEGEPRAGLGRLEGDLYGLAGEDACSGEDLHPLGREVERDARDHRVIALSDHVAGIERGVPEAAA